MNIATSHPFKTKYPLDEVTVSLVNSITPESSQHITVHENCPNCETVHAYKFINEPFKQVVDEENNELINYYHCECPTCEKPFAAKIEFCY